MIGLYLAHAFADFPDDADTFMTGSSSVLHTQHSGAHEMQIGAADSAGGQTCDGIESDLNGRFLDRVGSNVSDSMENDSFHQLSKQDSFASLVILSERDYSVWMPSSSRCLSKSAGSS